jgi:hypothetical protein
MQRCRLEAVRKMVEFDNAWLVNVGLRRVRPRPPSSLAGWLRLDRHNQVLIARSPLATVLRQLEAARNELSAAHQTIGQWARYKAGQPFPPEIEPAKSWCDTQDKLGELFVGFSDLAYRQAPAELVVPTQRLATLCAEQAAGLRALPANEAPPLPCATSSTTLEALCADLARLGWQRPPTMRELYTLPAR